MLRHFLLAISVLVTAVACDSGRPTAETAVLDKIKLLKDGGALDYAAAKQFFGAPLGTSGFLKTIVNGGKITFRSGEYYGGDTPEFNGARLNMEWRAEGFTAPGGWRVEKGLKSFLRASFPTRKICITKALLEAELGSGSEGRFSHGDDTTVNYGNADKRIVSFTFSGSECARNVDIIVTDPQAGWSTPSDAAAGDAEFVFKLSPLDTSGKNLVPLGFQCGPAGAASSEAGDIGCVCPRGHQTPAGPCRHAVTFIPYRKGDSSMKEGDVNIEVLPLNLPDMN
jgi:hypothetical protein